MVGETLINLNEEGQASHVYPLAYGQHQEGIQQKRFQIKFSSNIEGSSHYNNNFNKIIYSVLLNTGSVITLGQHQSLFYGQQSPQADRDYFIIHTEREGILLIEFKDCMGQFQVTGSHTLNDLFQNSYDVMYKQSFDGSTFLLSNLSSPTTQQQMQHDAYYLAVRSAHTDKKRASLPGLYQLRVTFFKKSHASSEQDIPNLQLAAGNAGLVNCEFVFDVHQIDKVFIKVGFKGPQPYNSIRFKKNQLSATVHVSAINDTAINRGIQVCKSYMAEHGSKYLMDS